MLQNEFLIVNKLGLHARASALFVKTASRFTSEVKLAREGVEVNGKSIMGIMMLAASKGSTVRLTVDGADEVDTMNTLSELITNGFGEE
ncbi:MAG: phosphocarrier protein HPr [Geobacteraceae bacterium GWC2_55_20]|nr:MAG: phosphocarrier protein HPr [Geobacteraceae bacterium GWC2_55_20]OGU25288.1 MAG: phosphocarrier protein HPr [Geobacteraceae bacterium GWF2_54_21]HBA71389.1 HPr family phosphocarrier protein [Geobacter sp.]HCE66314.1 HPr family phosphocarrier protein [Geobacter sp.]